MFAISLKTSFSQGISLNLQPDAYIVPRELLTYPAMRACLILGHEGINSDRIQLFR